MTGRIAATFPGAHRIERAVLSEGWDVYRIDHPGDIEDADAYLGTVYREGGAWYAVHALHTYTPEMGLDYDGEVTAPVLIATFATTTERNRNA